MKHDPRHRGYLINFSRPTVVRVDESRRSRDLLGDESSLRREMQQLAEERSQLPLDVEMEFVHGAGI